jgi:hypothetical protein
MINYTLITLCFLNLLSFSSHSYRTKVFNSAIVSFLPELKLHNVVTVKKEKVKPPCKFNHKTANFDSSINLNDFYVFDYTPKHQPDALGYVKMFLGYELPGIVRVIHIEKSSEEKLIEDWHKLAMKNPDYKKYLKKFGDKRINNIIEKWKTTFNVYSHNCRHFSAYFSKEIEKINQVNKRL